MALLRDGIRQLLTTAPSLPSVHRKHCCCGVEASPRRCNQLQMGNARVQALKTQTVNTFCSSFLSNASECNISPLNCITAYSFIHVFMVAAIKIAKYPLLALNSPRSAAPALLSHLCSPPSSPLLGLSDPASHCSLKVLSVFEKWGQWGEGGMGWVAEARPAERRGREGWRHTCMNGCGWT